MNSQYKNSGPYIRIRVSPATLKQGILFLGNVFQLVAGAESIVTGLKLKKTIERREKIGHLMNTAKVSTEVAGSIASAISDVVK